MLAAVLLAACSSPEASGPPPGGNPTSGPAGQPATSTSAAAASQLPPIPAARPGTPEVVRKGPPQAGNQLAITIDDGACKECIEGYTALAERGLHVTFCPNGQYHANWEPYAARISALVAQGRVQVCNHTYSHPNLLKLSDEAIAKELERNEEWIQQTFKVTSRPWLRPPFGNRDARVDAVAARLGFTKVVLWNGSFGDSGKLEPDVLLGEADKYLKPGVIMLGHVNHMTAVQVFDRINAMIEQRQLKPVTLDEMFGTSRATG